MTATEASLHGIGSKPVTKSQASRPSELVWYPFEACWHRTHAHSPSLWDARIAAKPPTIDHAAIMKSDDGVKQWTSLIVSHNARKYQSRLLTRNAQRKWGFCFIDGCPASGKATQELIERIAFIRQTHYGTFGSLGYLLQDLRAKRELTDVVQPQEASGTSQQTCHPKTAPTHL